MYIIKKEYYLASPFTEEEKWRESRLSTRETVWENAKNDFLMIILE